MPDDREHVRDKIARPLCWATVGIIIINVIIWLWEMWDYRTHPRIPVTDFFVLSLEGLRHGYIWQFLSYQFMHAVPQPWHLVLNCWAIFVFGRVVELTLGSRRMLQLYFLSGVIGGLVQMTCTWLFPGLFGDAGVVGASAGAFGLVAAFAVLYPRERLIMLLFFIIPLKLRATTLLWLSVALAVFGIFLPYLAPHLPPYLGAANLFGNMAHAAHLGGIATGFLFARQLIRHHQRRTPPVIETELKTPLNVNSTAD